MPPLSNEITVYADPDLTHVVYWWQEGKAMYGSGVLLYQTVHPVHQVLFIESSRMSLYGCDYITDRLSLNVRE